MRPAGKMNDIDSHRAIPCFIRPVKPLQRFYVQLIFAMAGYQDG
jgi:hypothetical protein